MPSPLLKLTIKVAFGLEHQSIFLAPTGAQGVRMYVSAYVRVCDILQKSTQNGSKQGLLQHSKESRGVSSRGAIASKQACN